MIRIIVDSSADYTLAELEERNIELIPLTINIGETCYRGGIDITADEIYEMLLAGETFPKTSQPSPQDYCELFERAKAAGDSVICLTVSSALSGTFQSANLAKSIVDYEDIYIIDSLAATHVIRVLAEHACQLRSEGTAAHEIAEALFNLRSRVKILAAVDSLDFLCKGGRLNKATALIGELANLKPILTLTETGTISIIGKCLGRNKALAYITKAISEKKPDPAFPVYSVYAYGSENTEKLEQKLSEIGIHCQKCLQIGPVIGVHVGPGAFAVIFVEQN